MRVRLRGIDIARVRLADGSIKAYHYARRGGPRLEGEPGSAEFIASYNAAVASKPVRRKAELESIVDAYLDSAEPAGQEVAEAGRLQDGRAGVHSSRSRGTRRAPVDRPRP